MPTADPTTAARLRAAVRDSGLTQAALARAAGTDQATVSRFLAGGDVKLATAAKLAAAVGLRLTLSGRGRHGIPP